MPPKRRSVLTEKSLNTGRSSPRTEVKKAVDSETTSDYGSAASSRTVTPSMPTPSPSPPPAAEQTITTSVEDVKTPSDITGGKGDQVNPNDEKDNTIAEDHGILRRAIKDEEIKQEDDITLDYKEDPLANGMISEEALKEEEAAREKNIKNEAANKPKPEPEISKKARYSMLLDLLEKSKFFVDYLKKKMEDEAETDKKRKEAREKRAQKGSKKDNSEGTKEEVPSATKGKRKRKADEIEDQTHEDVKNKKIKTESARFYEGQPISSRQPLLLSGGVMRTYQLEGFEWMAKLHEHGINGILADEMGLGKTIQTIALFSYLYELKLPGPYLVVVPLSTVPNWINEFKRFTPSIPSILYHGSKAERMEKRKLIGKSHYNEILGQHIYSVVVTSYEIAMNDRALLGPLRWKYMVVDEGHRLKNMECRLIKELKQYKTDNRLLLTGTPLQNNLRELFSLLNFILPEIFDNVNVFESWFDAKEIQEDEEGTGKQIALQEQKNSVVNMLHKILLPFLRRRIKADVGLEIPPKKEVLVYCPMTQIQKDLYQAVVERSIEDFLNVKKDDVVNTETHGRGKRERADIDYSIENASREVKTSYSAYSLKDKMSDSETNYSIKSRMMDMRKAVNHPYLIEYPITDGGFYKIDEEVIGLCGKMKVLDQMLNELMRKGHKILLFSQMTKMLDILGDYLNLRKLKFSRLDGSMNFVDRQDNIDKFNRDAEVKVFLLSTRAGGLGINLTAADTVIIYDSDWNPQQDLQAQDRCHRIGQTKPVMVYRLVTRGTFDEKIVLRAAAKRKIEKLVIHKDKFNSVTADTEQKAALRIDPEELLKLLHSKDHVGAVACSDGEVLSKEDLDKLLDRSDLSWSGQQDVKMKATVKKENKIKGVFEVLEDVDDHGVLDSVTE